MFAEQAVSFNCDGTQLNGIIHPGAASAKVGVLVVVGGPQYRVGSHRQFVHLARHLASQGVPVMRFDVSGMGDSEGDKLPFDRLDGNIRSAVDIFMNLLPRLHRVVLWGLCDAASAAMIYAHQDQRVSGLVLLNPWLENSQAKAKAQVSQYYARRFVDPAFWRKLLAGKGNIIPSVKEFLIVAFKSISRTAHPAERDLNKALPYQQRMLEGLKFFKGETFLVLSGNDLTAREFSFQLESDREWNRLLSENPITQAYHQEADHTFSTAQWKRWVEQQTLVFIASQERDRRAL